MGTISLGTERAPRRAGAALRATDVAWIALLPCALVTVVLVALLGPPLGHAFLGPGSESFWPQTDVHPEPVEHGRYLLALLGPALLGAAILLLARRPPQVSETAARRWALAAQLALIAFLVVCFAAQYDVVVSAYRPVWERTRYFTLPTLAIALAAPPLLLALARRVPRERLAGLVRETPSRRTIAAAVAVLLTALWLMTAVVTDGSLANTFNSVASHLLWTMDEPFAILNGRTPLVDFHAQYGQLLPYAAAGAMSLLGTSIGVFTITMATVSGLSLLAIYAVLRRIVRSSLLALALFLPFVATGFYMKTGTLDNRFGPANLFSLWPIRYAGPYLLAWLLARHLDDAAPRRPWILFLAGGIAAVNNPEFGLGAVGAVAVALLLVRPPRSRAAVWSLLLQAAGGLLGALALVALLTLVRSGSLPHLGWALEFSKLYGVGGWVLLPMPKIGLYLAVYVTFAAAIAVAAVRTARRAQDVLLTAMLAWSGVFGLLAGAYFAGRSHPQVLIDLFSPWALSLVLLTIVVVRGLAARGWRRPAPAELAVLCGLALLCCSLAQTPTPWSQMTRIRNRASISLFKQNAAAAFIAERTQPGERIEILIPLGHRIAYDIGRVDVSPYASLESMPTRQQLTRALTVLRREGGTRIYVSGLFTLEEELHAIRRAGYVADGQTQDETGVPVIELVRRRG